jgi:nucleoside-diphosphate-sugar epimerase
MRELTSALVLGGGGFIGRWLVRSLLARGAQVTVISRSGADEPGAEWHTADLRSVEIAPIVVARRIDTVFDLAGSADAPGSIHAPLSDLDSNGGQTVRVLEALRHVPTPPLYVYGSSAAVYGRVAHLPIAEDDPVAPLSPYAVSKLAAEQYLSLYRRVHGQPGIALRFFSVYGPGQRKQAIFDLLRQAQEPGPELHVRAPADVTRDFIFVRDVVEAAVDVAERAPGHGEVYNVASGVETSMEDLAAGILAASKAHKNVSFGAELRPGDPHRYVGATRRIAALGVRLETPLADGLAQTAAWLHANRGTPVADAATPPRHTGARMRPARIREVTRNRW